MTTTAAARPPTWLQFIVWALVGASGCLVLLGVFTIGPLALVPAAVFAVAAVLMKGGNISAIGAIAGPGLWGFVIAWLNRNGPGNICTTSGTGGSCEQQWAPWPFVIAGVLLAGVPVVCFAIAKRPHST